MTALKRIKALDVLTTVPELLTHHLTVRPDDVAYKVYGQRVQVLGHLPKQR